MAAGEPKIVRCAIYTRQSVVGAGGDPAVGSCAVQRDLCFDFVRSMAWRGWYPMAERFDDEGESGASIDRPALDALVARVEAGAVGRVIVYRLDRLTRKLSDWARLAALFEHFDVGLTVVAGGVHAEGGSLARMQLNMLAVFAELERDMIAERLADARAARKARGERSAGQLPLGYASDPATKQLVVVEAEADVVRWFFDEAAKGLRTSEILSRARSLGLHGKRSEPRAWASRGVLRMLRNPVYAGRRPDGQPAMHEPIVAPELFDRVQSVITARRTRHPTTRAKTDPRTDPFFLRGLLVCERCGKKMTTSTSARRTKRRSAKAPRYYRCRTQRCGGGQVAAGEVETEVLDLLRAPGRSWPASTKAKAAEIAECWDLLWPVHRSAELARVFDTIAWRARTRRLIVKAAAGSFDDH